MYCHKTRSRWSQVSQALAAGTRKTTLANDLGFFASSPPETSRSTRSIEGLHVFHFVGDNQRCFLMKASVVFNKFLRKQNSKTKGQKTCFKMLRKQPNKQAGQKLCGNKFLHRSICTVCKPNPHRGYVTITVTQSA